MSKPKQHHNWLSGAALHAAAMTFVVLWFGPIATPLAQAQTFTLLYTFPGSLSGAEPLAGLTRDGKGNLYGTTYGGGGYGRGLAFKLSKTGLESPLYQFKGGPSDGGHPGSTLLPGSGNLYGTTGGGFYGFGTVFELTPKVSGGWTEVVLYTFTGGTDGSIPQSELVQDTAGNLYGTTFEGGLEGGTVFELTPSGTGWTETVLHSFSGQADGLFPNPGLIRDAAGNLYGTTGSEGAGGYGTIFKLMPPVLGGGAWQETVLYSLIGGAEGAYPRAGVVRDPVGNLYGTTVAGGDPICSCGVVFMLNESGKETVLYTFHGGTDGAYPTGLTFGSSGVLYGTTGGGGGSTACNAYSNGCGTVFQLDVNGTYNVLYRFTGGTDGAFPNSRLIRDSGGNLYGTASKGGAYSRGTIFMITP